ncbi:hypothetical protein GCM10017687_82580 [Streptomyces echinatus]
MGQGGAEGGGANDTGAGLGEDAGEAVFPPGLTDVDLRTLRAMDDPAVLAAVAGVLADPDGCAGSGTPPAATTGSRRPDPGMRFRPLSHGSPYVARTPWHDPGSRRTRGGRTAGRPGRPRPRSGPARDPHRPGPHPPRCPRPPPS